MANLNLIVEFNALGVLTSSEGFGNIRQGDVGEKIYASFQGKSNADYIATFNLTRSDGTKVSNILMNPSVSDSVFNYTFSDPWFFAKAGTTTLTIFLRDGGGNVLAQGQVQFSVEATDYDEDPEITVTQYNSLLAALAGKADKTEVAKEYTATGKTLAELYAAVGEIKILKFHLIGIDQEGYYIGVLSPGSTSGSYNFEFERYSGGERSSKDRWVGLNINGSTLLNNIFAIDNTYYKPYALKEEIGHTYSAGTGININNDVISVNQDVIASKSYVGEYFATKSSVQAIESLIPAQASVSNQLADKDFVNSSIATQTSNFLGTFNLVTDLGLTASATHSEVATAIATKLASLSIVPTNHDYVFVGYPNATVSTQYDQFDRYKYNASTSLWGYEYTLNNSSFTAEQWAAINSGITAAMISEIYAHLAEGNPGIPSGVNPTILSNLKIGNNYYLIPSLPTVGSSDKDKYLHTNSSTGELEWVVAPSGGSSVTLNGSASASPSFYAPLSGGTGGEVLVANGSGNAPTWESVIYDYSSTTLATLDATAWGNLKANHYADISSIGTISGFVAKPFIGIKLSINGTNQFVSLTKNTSTGKYSGMFFIEESSHLYEISVYYVSGSTPKLVLRCATVY